MRITYIENGAEVDMTVDDEFTVRVTPDGRIDVLDGENLLIASFARGTWLYCMKMSHFTRGKG